MTIRRAGVFLLLGRMLNAGYSIEFLTKQPLIKEIHLNLMVVTMFFNSGQRLVYQK
jgi:hypothetical protein